jgi:hypothetical protein
VPSGILFGARYPAHKYKDSNKSLIYQIKAHIFSVQTNKTARRKIQKLKINPAKKNKIRKLTFFLHHLILLNNIQNLHGVGKKRLQIHLAPRCLIFFLEKPANFLLSLVTCFKPTHFILPNNTQKHSTHYNLPEHTLSLSPNNFTNYDCVCFAV